MGGGCTKDDTDGNVDALGAARVPLGAGAGSGTLGRVVPAKGDGKGGIGVSAVGGLDGAKRPLLKREPGVGVALMVVTVAAVVAAGAAASVALHGDADGCAVGAAAAVVENADEAAEEKTEGAAGTNND